MSTVYKYRIHCVTDNTQEFIWSESTPTACPTNTAHTIDTDSIVIIETREQNVFEVKEELHNASYKSHPYSYPVYTIRGNGIRRLE